MISTLRTTWLAVGLLIAWTVVPAAVTDEQAEVEHLLHEFLAGASRDDAAMHDRFWAEDLVYTSSSGERFGKPRIMASLEESGGGASGPTYSAENVSVRVFGDLAVVTFRLVAERDGSREGEFFNTGVLRRQDESWKAFTWQATRIPLDD
ncbi:MAG: nuclear transport factor 2 family protein [Wenzhouxiangellaceae bacterium]|nr:nuclear transport factor 2 family protein [Wenzhouxiangellaceae bacterium]